MIFSFVSVCSAGSPSSLGQDFNRVTLSLAKVHIFLVLLLDKVMAVVLLDKDIALT